MFVRLILMLACCATGVLSWPAAAPGDLLATGAEWPQEPRSGGGLVFRHGSHLAPDWQQTPADRQWETHCSVCHERDENRASGFVDAATKCAQCHHNDPDKRGGDRRRLEFEGGRRPGALAFDHASPTHRQRDCIECHTPNVGPRGDFPYPDVLFSLPADLRACQSCHQHGAKDPAAGKQTQFDRAAGVGGAPAAWAAATTCAHCHVAGAPVARAAHQRATLRPFQHASHLPADPAAQAAACATCHQVNAEGRLGLADRDQKVCAKCHAAADAATTTGLAADLQVERMPSTFTHSTKGHQQACDVCHPRGQQGAEPMVQRLYKDCTTSCHSDWRIPRHGSFGCDQCHATTPTLGQKDAGDIAITTVERTFGAARFQFQSPQHVGITAGAGGTHPNMAGRECRECHRSTPAALQQRTEPRAFDHASHLPKGLAGVTKSECTACHVHVVETSSPELLAPFRSDSLRERRTCTSECHRCEAIGIEEVRRALPVPKFDHKRHEQHECVVCHVRDGKITSGRDALLQGGLGLACSQCHGHRDPEKARITGGYDATPQSPACSNCHLPREAPQFGRAAERQQRDVLLAGALQFHAKGGDCRYCHELNAPDRRSGTPLRIVAHRTLHEAHVVPGADGRPGNLPTVSVAPTCRSCHAWEPRR